MLKFFLFLILIFIVFSKDYYEVLGISKNASEREIRKAYKKLALKYHPDRNKGKNTQKEFIEVSKAYEILKDPKKRKQYDTYGSEDDQQQEYDNEQQGEQGNENPYYQFKTTDFGQGFKFNFNEFKFNFQNAFDMFKNFFQDEDEEDEEENESHKRPKFKEINFDLFKSIKDNNYHFSHIPQLIYVYPNNRYCGICGKVSRILDASKERFKGLSHFKMLGLTSKSQ